MKIKSICLLLLLILSFQNSFAAITYSPEYGWRWSQLVLKPTPKEQLEYCLSLEKKNQYSSAIAHYKLLIKTYNSSVEAIEAYNRIGELYMMQKKWNKAQKYYEELLSLQIEETSKVIQTLNKKVKKKKKKDNKLSDQEKQLMFSILLRGLQKSAEKDNSNNPLLNLDINRIFNNLYTIANAYIDGARYKILGVIPLYKQKSKFISVYSYILLRAPNYEHCPAMQKAIALYKLEKKDYLSAISEFKKLSYDYSLSPEAQDVSYYLGVCKQKSSKGPAFNQDNMDFAEANIKDYLLSQPDGKMVKQAKEVEQQILASRAENTFIKIKFFIRRKQWAAAKIYINELVKKYPNTKFAATAQKLALRYKEIGS
jgi:outer membrane protein assembly factor BamD (BamD/ComL family)